MSIPQVQAERIFAYSVTCPKCRRLILRTQMNIGNIPECAGCEQLVEVVSIRYDNGCVLTKGGLVQ